MQMLATRLLEPQFKRGKTSQKTPMKFVYTVWCLKCRYVSHTHSRKDGYSYSMLTPPLQRNVFELSGKISRKGMKVLQAAGEKS